MLSVALWVLYAALLCIGAMKIIDLLTPGKLEDHVFKDNNVAAAIVYGCVFIGFAIIIASALH